MIDVLTAEQLSIWQQIIKVKDQAEFLNDTQIDQIYSLSEGLPIEIQEWVTEMLALQDFRK